MATGSSRRRRRYVETSDFLAAVARLVSSAGRRVGEGDPDEFRQLLVLQREVEAALVTAVAGLREASVTWEQIGEMSGTTRQAALMRWNPKLAERAGG